MKPRASMQLTIIAAALAQGFLSMGFQLVATRVIAPFFGSTMIVWAFVISTFLAAFSIGAMLGGACSRLTPRRIQASMRVIGIVGVAGFVVTAALGHWLTALIDRNLQDFLTGLGLTCLLLFFVPIAALSSMLPIFTEVLVKTGGRSGLSTGLIYGVSTIGNILGVMATAFVLIPHLHISTVLAGWAVGSAICFGTFYVAVRAVVGREPESPFPAMGSVSAGPGGDPELAVSTSSRAE